MVFLHFTNNKNITMMRFGFTIVLVAFAFLRFTCEATCGGLADGQEGRAPSAVGKFDLTGIQDTVHRAFYNDMSMQRDEALPKVIKALDAGMEGASKSKEQLLTYWRSYARYYSAVYYMQTKQPAKASSVITEGIRLLQSEKQKGSEEYALLARLQGIALSFAGPRAPQVAQEMVQNSANAIELDSSNVRAYVVAAINDYFTPKAFGGRQRTKEYLTKALMYPVQRIGGDYMPSWGREEAYEYLLRYTLEEENGKGIAALYEKAIQEFPNSYMIRSLEPRVKGQ